MSNIARVRFLSSKLRINCAMTGYMLNEHFSSICHFAGLRNVSMLPCGVQNARRNLLLVKSAKKYQWKNFILLTDVPQMDLNQERSNVLKTKEEEEETAKHALNSLSDEDQEKFKVIQLEFEVMEQLGMGEEVLNSRLQRAKYYKYLRLLELSKQNQLIKRKEKQKLMQAELSSLPSDPVEKQAKSTIFLRIYESTINKVGDQRLVNAMLFGQPLVFDMNYEQLMRHQDISNMVEQLSKSHNVNRDDRNPFHFILTDVDPNGKVLPLLWKHYLAGNQFMGTVTSSSYLDLFPGRQLVYLSPHARDMLDTVHPDTVYIIGGINDKANQQKESLARAKEQRIQAACLPLDRFLLWGQGSKSLPLNQVVEILLDQKRSGNWNDSFSAIPKRKLFNPDADYVRTAKNRRRDSMSWLNDIGDV